MCSELKHIRNVTKRETTLRTKESTSGPNVEDRRRIYSEIVTPEGTVRINFLRQGLYEEGVVKEWTKYKKKKRVPHG